MPSLVTLESTDSRIVDSFRYQTVTLNRHGDGSFSIDEDGKRVRFDGSAANLFNVVSRVLDRVPVRTLLD